MDLLAIRGGREALGHAEGGSIGGVGGDAAAESSAGPARTAEDVAQFTTFEIVGAGASVSSSQHADLKYRAMTAFAHYHRYCIPRRVLAIAPGTTTPEIIRHTIADFTSSKPDGNRKSSANSFRPLWDWLVHHSANLTSAAVYVQEADTIDVVLNHRALCASSGWATTRGKKGRKDEKRNGKGK